MKSRDQYTYIITLSLSFFPFFFFILLERCNEDIIEGFEASEIIPSDSDKIILLNTDREGG
jgi:hypothetical protein